MVRREVTGALLSTEVGKSIGSGESLHQKGGQGSPPFLFLTMPDDYKPNFAFDEFHLADLFEVDKSVADGHHTVYFECPFCNWVTWRNFDTKIACRVFTCRRCEQPFLLITQAHNCPCSEAVDCLFLETITCCSFLEEYRTHHFRTLATWDL